MTGAAIDEEIVDRTNIIAGTKVSAGTGGSSAATRIQSREEINMDQSKENYIDLHTHLDGSITPKIAEQLAAIQGTPLPFDRAELERRLRVPADCTDLETFLSCFALPVSLLQTYESLREAARLVAEDMKSQSIIYAEIRYAPRLHTVRGMSQEDAVKAVLEGIGQSGLAANVILCCMRMPGNDLENRETVELAGKYLVEDGGVVALDLAGAEAPFPLANYRELFGRARALGIPVTIHAGEAAGADNVRRAIELGAKRIGHGVRIYENPAVMELVKEKGIVLEMCPTSNRQTCAVPDMHHYPLMAYLDQGIKVTLNTDDPAIEGTDIRQEYRYMEAQFGLTAAQRKILLANAVEGAFTADRVKAKLKQTLGL